MLLLLPGKNGSKEVLRMGGERTEEPEPARVPRTESINASDSKQARRGEQLMHHGRTTVRQLH